MSATSSNTSRFLYAAKLAMLKTLKQLEENCHLVTVTCDLIHEFQKERGVSNVYLASIGNHYPQRRSEQVRRSESVQACLIAILNKHYLDSKQNTDNHRLLFSITLSLQGIDNLSRLRYLVEHHKITPVESTQAYCRLISSLISIIFEAADIASDAQVTARLVSLFNFIQAKEYAGQERAWGAIGFAESHFSEPLCKRLSYLQHAQQDSIKVFLEYTDTQHKAAWAALEAHQASAEVNKFRKLIAQLSNAHAVSSEISEVWYELATQRIDQMHIIESSLSQELIEVSKQRVKENEAQLRSRQGGCNEKYNQQYASDSPLPIIPNPNLPGLLGLDPNEVLSESSFYTSSLNSSEGSQLNKSLYDLLFKQARRIEEMSCALDDAKQSLLDQKLISRAKLLLIQQFGLSETGAHQKIQQASMKQGLSLVQVAQNLINAATAKLRSPSS